MDKKTRDILLALAAHWRSEGEYWDGTPEDKRSQHCADELLKIIGATDSNRVTMDQRGDLLKPFGITNHEPPDRRQQYCDDFDFMETKGSRFVRLIFKELGDWGRRRPVSKKEAEKRGYPDIPRPLDVLIHEKLWWAYTEGWNRGHQRGAQDGRKKYKRGGK